MQLPTAHDIPADTFLNRLSKHLKENIGEVTPPSWSVTSKTGSHREFPPQDRDWWYMRCASLLRKLYLHGPLGISKLRVEYGGRKRKGRRIEHVRPSGGSSIREPLQQLERAGLVMQAEKKGRKLSKDGVSLLNKLSSQMMKETRSSAKGETK
jgi:small subunit ribosomal protein S19e